MSNPISRYRQSALATLIGALKIVRAIDGDHCGIWPGIDGYTYSFGTPFHAMWEAFEDAVAEAMDAVPGVIVFNQVILPPDGGRVIADGAAIPFLPWERFEGGRDDGWSYDTKRKAVHARLRNNAGTVLSLADRVDS